MAEEFRAIGSATSRRATLSTYPGFCDKHRSLHTTELLGMVGESQTGVIPPDREWLINRGRSQALSLVKWAREHYSLNGRASKHCVAVQHYTLLLNGIRILMPHVLTNLTLLSDGQRQEGWEIAFEGEIITQVGPAGSCRSRGNVQDLNGCIVAPGFIDLQVNGAGGVLFQHAPNPLTIDTMVAALRRLGVTSFLPTLTASSPEKLAEAVSTIRHCMAEHSGTVLGLNMEGPFINPQKAGMADASATRKYERGSLSALFVPSSIPLLMTIAPEALRVENLDELLSYGTVVAIGHTAASYEHVCEFFTHGVKITTHAFNAMTGVSGREPGVVGALLDTDAVFTSLIADGYHVHPANARLLWRELGPHRIFLISDGMPSLGSTVREFHYNEHVVTDREGKCTTAEGVLAGTGIDLLSACKNMAHWLNIDIAVALQMITSNPARAFGLEGKYGSIRPGAFANFVVMSRDLVIDSVYVNGYAD